MQIARLIIFSTVIVLIIGAGAVYLFRGIYGWFTAGGTQNTEVTLGRYLSIKTTIPALVLCLFGLILLLTARIVDDKIEIIKLTTAVSKQSSELAELRKDNEQLTDSLNTQSSELADLRDFESTRERLKMTRTVYGTLIARNHDEIEELRRLGQRDYFEFTIKARKAQKSGDFTFELKSTNTEKNQFTISLLVGGHTFEKKNRAVNEPIFFYTVGSRVPKELVVNKVSKDTASGYLSVSKFDESKSGSPSGTIVLQ